MSEIIHQNSDNERSLVIRLPGNVETIVPLNIEPQDLSEIVVKVAECMGIGQAGTITLRGEDINMEGLVDRIELRVTIPDDRFFNGQ